MNLMMMICWTKWLIRMMTRSLQMMKIALMKMIGTLKSNTEDLVCMLGNNLLLDIVIVKWIAMVMTLKMKMMTMMKNNLWKALSILRHLLLVPLQVILIICSQLFCKKINLRIFLKKIRIVSLIKIISLRWGKNKTTNFM